MRISDWSSDVCSSDLLDPHHAVTVAAHGDRCFQRRDANLARRFRQGTAHPKVAAAQQDGGEDRQPAEDDHKDAPNRSHRSTYTAFDPSHACGLLTGHPGPSMPAKPLTDPFPPADSRSGTAKPPAPAGPGGGPRGCL